MNENLILLFEFEDYDDDDYDGKYYTAIRYIYGAKYNLILLFLLIFNPAEPTFEFYDNCTDIPDWMDEMYGDSCIDYPNFDDPGCPYYGDDLGFDGNNTANDACCYCGGGTECSNLEGWVDSGNDTCAWYIENDSPGCPLSGDMYPDADGITASDACCYCQVDVEVADDGKY